MDICGAPAKIRTSKINQMKNMQKSRQFTKEELKIYEDKWGTINKHLKRWSTSFLIEEIQINII